MFLVGTGGLLFVFFFHFDLFCIGSNVAKGGLGLFSLLKEDLRMSVCEIWPAHFSAEE